LPEQRQVILSISASHVDLLVAYELPAGVQAREIRGFVDMNGDWVVDSPLEQLARAQILLSRLRSGLSVTVDGVEVPLSLERIEISDGAGEGRLQGFEAMALFSADWSVEPNREIQVSLGVAENTPPVRAELQVLEGLTIVSSDLPVAPDAPVVGPTEIRSTAPLTVGVRRD